MNAVSKTFSILNFWLDDFGVEVLNHTETFYDFMSRLLVILASILSNISLALSTIFLFDFGTVPAVWNFLFFYFTLLLVFFLIWLIFQIDLMVDFFYLWMMKFWVILKCLILEFEILYWEVDCMILSIEINTGMCNWKVDFNNICILTFTIKLIIMCWFIVHFKDNFVV